MTRSRQLGKRLRSGALSVGDLLRRIARVNRVDVRVRDGRGTVRVVNGVGAVDATRAGSTVTYRENGSWRGAPAAEPRTDEGTADASAMTEDAAVDVAGVRFRNELRWRAAGERALLLERPRPAAARSPTAAGPALSALDASHAPVRLELRPDATGAWVSVAAYVCGADVYTVRLEVQPGTLTLVWIVRGPRKDQVITCTYTS